MLMKNLYGATIVVCAILIAILQFCKERDDEKEAVRKEGELKDTHAKLHAANEDIKGKADSIRHLQEEALKGGRELARMQGDAITLQIYLNKRQEELNEFVIAAGSKPKISIENYGTAPYPGRPDNPSTPRYKPVKIYVTNTGNAPIRDMTIRISGSMGFNFLDGGGRDYSEYDQAKRKLDNYVMVGPMTLPPNHPRNVIFNGNYEAFTTYVSYAIDITWENGFYTMFATLEPIDFSTGQFMEPQQAQPRAHLRVKSVKYMIGNRPVAEADLFGQL
jgi:hypothetical protein